MVQENVGGGHVNAPIRGLLSPSANGFLRGLAYAATQMSETFGQPSVAAQIIRESGSSLEEFECSGADAGDLDCVRSLFANEPALR